MSRTVLRVLLLAAFLAAIVGAFASGILQEIDLADLRGRMRDSGTAGAVAFVVAVATLQPFGVSAYFFLLSASAVWPAPVAVGLSWLGIMGAGILSFGFSRFVAYEWVHARMGTRLSKWDRRLATTGFRTVLITRLLFFTTVPVQLMYGVSSVRFGDFLAGSAVGILPTSILVVAVGAEVIDWFAEQPASSWVPFAVVGVLIAAAVAAAVFVARRRRNR